MPTLTELIKESLEGKLTDQIRASLASKMVRTTLMTTNPARASRNDTEFLVH